MDKEMELQQQQQQRMSQRIYPSVGGADSSTLPLVQLQGDEEPGNTTTTTSQQLVHHYPPPPPPEQQQQQQQQQQPLFLGSPNAVASPSSHLVPKSRFDYLLKAEQRSCGCLPFWVPMLAVLLAGAALAGYYAWSDKQPANPSLPAKINENGPVFILVAIEIILCLTAAIFLFCTRTIRRSLLAKIISILFSIALFVLGVEMWRNKFQDVDYCNVATDLGNQLGQDNGKNYHDYIWLVSGLLALLSTLIASFNIYMHCSNYNYPLHQRYIVRVLFMIPVYAILTLASLLLYRHFFIWIMFRDFYESYVVYSFYWLVRYHLGDSIELQIETLKFFYKQELSHKYHSLKEKMANKKLSSSGARRMRAIEDFQARQRLNFLPFLNGLVRVKWMEYDPFSESFLIKTEKFVLLYVFIRVITSFFAVIMNGFNVYCDSNLFSPGTISTAILNFFGVSVAVGSLFLLVLAAHPAMSARGLESKSCETKFWSVKGFVMLMFYQSIMVALVWKPLIGKYFLPTATWNSVQLKQALLNFATLIDLVLFALLHLRAYKYSVYIPKSRLDEPANNCCCGGGSSKADKHEPIDIEYRAVLNRRDVNCFGPLHAFVHALKPADLHKISNKHMLNDAS